MTFCYQKANENSAIKFLDMYYFLIVKILCWWDTFLIFILGMRT